MLRKFVVFSSAFTLAFLILIISIFKLAQVNYAFTASPSPVPENQVKPTGVPYNLAYPGSILSDSALWPVKALRDKVWLALTIDPSKKADLYLLLADKRLADAEILFKNNKADLGISVLTKAEKYLESAGKEEKIARGQGMDTKAFLNKFSLAALKHRQVMEEILQIAPEDAKPLIVKTEDYPKSLYLDAKNGLIQQGSTFPQSPFSEN